MPSKAYGASPNPAALIQFLEAQTRSLFKLEQVRELPDEMHFDAAASEELILASLRSLLTTLHPEDRILNRIVTTGNPKVAALLFDVHGAENYHSALTKQTISQVSLGEPVKRANIALLKVFHDNGFNLNAYVDKMLGQAIRHRNQEYLSFVLDDIGAQTPILVAVKHDIVFDDPWPPILDILAREVRQFACAKNTVVYSMLLGAFSSLFNNPPRLREAALCLHLNPEIAKDLDRNGISVKSPSLLRLIDMTRSNHGKIALRKMEPDLDSLLSRPLTSPFYGITQEKVAKEVA